MGKYIRKEKRRWNIWHTIKHKILELYFTYQGGELVLVAARRKHGKSIFGMNELVHMLKNG